MPQIKNKVTGFIANASDADWSSGVYGSSWNLVDTPATPVNPVTQTAPINQTLSKSSDTRTWSVANPQASMTAEGLGSSETKIELPTATPGADTSGEITGGAGMSAEQLQDKLNELGTAKGKEAEAKISDYSSKMSELLDETAGKAEEQLSLEEQYKLPQLRSDYASLNTQIQTRLAEYEALNVSIEGKPITMSSIIGQQAQVNKTKLAEIGLLQARATGLSGEIETAQSQVDRAIDIKYSVIDQNISIYQAQINLLNDIVSGEDEKVLVQKQLMLDEYTQQVADDKATEKAVNNLAIVAQSNGADSRLVSMISNATTEVEANQIAGELANSDGWAYVQTIPERDSLIKQGYEMTETGGRTYARQPAESDATVQSYVDQIRNGRIKLTNVPSGIRNAVSLALSTTPVTPQTPSPSPSPVELEFTPEEEDFQKDFSAELKKLQKGGDWGSSWDYLHNRYPEATNEQLDAILEKDKYYNN